MEDARRVGHLVGEARRDVVLQIPDTGFHLSDGRILPEDDGFLAPGLSVGLGQDVSSIGHLTLLDSLLLLSLCNHVDLNPRLVYRLPRWGRSFLPAFRPLPRGLISGLDTGLFGGGLASRGPFRVPIRPHVAVLDDVGQGLVAQLGQLVHDNPRSLILDDAG